MSSTTCIKITEDYSKQPIVCAHWGHLKLFNEMQFRRVPFTYRRLIIWRVIRTLLRDLPKYYRTPKNCYQTRPWVYLSFAVLTTTTTPVMIIVWHHHESLHQKANNLLVCVKLKENIFPAIFTIFTTFFPRTILPDNCHEKKEWRGKWNVRVYSISLYSTSVVT